MYTSSIYCIFEPFKLLWHAMSKPYNTLHELDWEQFFESGYLLEDLATNTIWVGYGQSDSSALSFFHTKFFQKKMILNHPKTVFIVDRELFWIDFDRFCLKNFKLSQSVSIDKEFLTEAKELVEVIKSGDFEKIVPVTFKGYEYEGHPLITLLKLRSLQGNTYGFWGENGGVLGCSPEILYRRDNGVDEFLALAGTAEIKNKFSARNLIESEKDQKEHALVVKDIKSKLQSVGYREIELSKTETVEFGPLVHLRTKIKALSGDVRISNLIAKLHPTAALCGYPEEKAMAYLKNLEHYQLHGEDRLFGGIFGIEYEDFSLAVVMIRNLQWQGKKLWIQSGCGIVEASDPELELNEVRSKRKTIEDLI
ncbi:MAG: hypothetical protein CME65_13570 [Halobacteriovoraceae bacterium]|nr:hypothetical protein [Halobacteriovoraceae bacterium]